MTTRKSRNTTKGGRKAAKTIDLKAEDITERVEQDGDSDDARLDPQTDPSNQDALDSDDARLDPAPVENSDREEEEQPQEPSNESIADDVAASDDADDARIEEAAAAETSDVESEMKPDPEQSTKTEEITAEAASNESAAPVSTPPAAKGGFGSGLIGGLLGGVAVLGLGYAGLTQGIVSLPSSPAANAEQEEVISGLQKDVSGLTGKISALPAIDVAAFEARFADLESKMSGLSEQLGQTGDGGNDASEGASTTPVPAVDLGPISEELAKLGGDLSGLAQRVDGLEGVNAQLVAMREKLAAFEASAVEQSKSLAGKLEQAQKDILSSADRRIDNLVTDLSVMGKSVAKDAKALTDRVTSLEQNNVGEQMQSSARTIALAGLESAVATGRSFKASLDTFAKVVSDSDAVQALQAHAQKGAPTIEALSEQFMSVSGSMLKAAEGAEAKSVIDKIVLNAKSLVRIRAVGEVEGTSLSAQLARIEVRVNDGRLKEADQEWQSLPEAAKAAGKDWIEGLRARMSVDDAMQSIRAAYGSDSTKTQ